MHSKLILKNLDSQNSLFNLALCTGGCNCLMIYNCMLTLHVLLKIPGASAQTEEVHEEEIESGVEEKEEEEEEEVEVVVEEEEEEVVVTSSDEDEDAEEIFQE